MGIRLQNAMKRGYNDALDKGEKGRPDWVQNHIAQVILTIASALWSETC